MRWGNCHCCLKNTTTTELNLSWDIFRALQYLSENKMYLAELLLLLKKYNHNRTQPELGYI
jgi:hypothetical protein